MADNEKDFAQRIFAQRRENLEKEGKYSSLHQNLQSYDDSDAAYIFSRRKEKKKKEELAWKIADGMIKQVVGYPNSEKVSATTNDVVSKKTTIKETKRLEKTATNYIKNGFDGNDDSRYAWKQKADDQQSQIPDWTQEYSRRANLNRKKAIEEDSEEAEKRKSGFEDENGNWVSYDRLKRLDFSKLKNTIEAGEKKTNALNLADEKPGISFGVSKGHSEDEQNARKALRYNLGDMTDDEKNLYYYINAKYGSAAATNYVDSIKAQLNKRTMDRVKKNAETLGREHPIVGALVDVGMSLGGALGYGSLLAEGIGKTVVGKSVELDPNDPRYISGITAESIQQGIKNNEGIQKAIPNQGVRDFGVGVALSLGENLARVPLGAAGLAFAAGSAGLSGSRSAVERGGNQEQVIASGLTNALAEAFFEKFSLENLRSLKTTPGKGVKVFLGNVAKQAFTEGSEEIATEIANTLSDAAIMQELGTYNQEYINYREQGASDGEAKRRAFQSFLTNIGLAGLGGAVSGGVMGAGAQALGKIQNQLNTRQKAEEYTGQTDTAMQRENQERQETSILHETEKNEAEREGRDTSGVENYIESRIGRNLEERGEIDGTPELESESLPQSNPEIQENSIGDSREYRGIMKEMSAELGEKGEEMLEKTYDGESDPFVYFRSFAHAYNQGYFGTEVTQDQQRADALILGADAYGEAFKAGALDKNAIVEQSKMLVKNAEKGEMRSGGLGTISEYATEPQRKIAEHIGRYTGLTINLVDGLSNPEATASYKHGSITLDVNSKDFGGAISHELTHFIRDYSPDLYESYERYVGRAVSEAEGIDFEDMIQEYQRRYEAAGQRISRADAIEEIVSDAAQDFLKDETFIRNMVEENTTLSQKIVDFLKDVIESIKSLIETGSTRKAAKALEQDLAAWEWSCEAWMKFLDESSKRRKSGLEIRKTEEQSDTKQETEKGTAEKENFERFQVKEPVEEKKDLIAVHNLTEEKLEKILEYEGIPAPSIAITKAELGHENYGEVSLVFYKDTIDPKADRKNKVYGADAWTPTFPGIEYEADENVVRRVTDELRELREKVPEVYSKEVRNFELSIKSEIDSQGGYDGMVKNALDNTALKAAYLASIGESVNAQTRATRIELPEVQKHAYEAIVKAFDGDLQSLTDQPISEYADRLSEAFERGLIAGGEDEATAKSRAAGIKKSWLRIKSTLRKAIDYQKNGGVTIEKDVDVGAMNKDVNDRVNEQLYAKWVKRLFGGIERRRGIWNGKERVTWSGDRKSFAQTHLEVTAENIVKAMKMQSGGMKNVGEFKGVRSVQAAVTPEFKSVEQIRKAGKKLKNVSEEKYQQAINELNGRLSGVVDAIVKETKGESSYLYVDALGESIVKACKKPTKENFETVLRDDSWNVTDAQANELKRIAEDVKNMPVDMFEAKPERVVRYDEIAAAVVPSTINQGVVEQLEMKRIPVVEYDPNLPDARKKAVNELKDVKFQLNEEEEAQMEMLKRENANLRAANENLRKQFERSSKNERYQEGVAKVASKLLKNYKSNLDKKDFASKIGRLYEYMNAAEKPDWEAVEAESKKLARKMLLHSTEIDTTLKDIYKDVRRQLRETKITLSEQDKADLAVTGGYNTFRKTYFGRLRLGDGGISIDSIYQELSTQHPELFPADVTHPADQLMTVAHMLDETGDHVQNPYDANMGEMIEIVSQEILDGIADVKMEPVTLADRQAAEIETLKAKWSKNMNEYKKEITNRYLRKNQQEIKKSILAERQKVSDEYNRIVESERMTDEDRKRIKELKEKNRDLNRELSQVKYLTSPKEYVESMQEHRQQRQKTVDKNQVIRGIASIQKMLLRPDNKKHVPDSVKGIVMDFLRSIDYSTEYTNRKGEKTARTRGWDELLAFYDQVKDGGEWTGDNGETVYLDLDADMVARLKELKQQVYDLEKLDDLTPHQMAELRKAVASMGKTIMEMNDLKANERAETVSQLAEDAIKDLEKIRKDDWNGKRGNSREGRKEYAGAIGAVDQLLNYDNMTPYTAFYKMGSAMSSIYTSLRGAADQKTLYLKNAQDYVEEAQKELKVTPKELKEWTGKNAEVKKFTVSGGKISLTTAQIMSLYEANKRGQAREHIYGDGIRGADAVLKLRDAETTSGKLRQKLTPAQILKSYKPIRVTPMDVEAITGTLTDKQKKFADAMQRYLSENAAQWGNAASLEMYGYKKFEARDYFPIRTDYNFINTKEGERSQNPKTMVRNLGMTKSTVRGANNAVLVEDIFDVFTRHVDQMSTYGSFLAPLSDFNKIYNYKVRSEDYTTSMKQEIERAMGKNALEYLETLVDDINGLSNYRADSFDKLLLNMKAAAVSMSLSVAIQQPTSYLRAVAEMNPKYLVAAAPTIKTGKSKAKEWELITHYAPIAQWKDWGFYQMNTARSMKEIMFGTDSLKDRFVNAGTALAGKGDELTWRRIWRACEAETKDKHKDLKVGSEEYYRQVGKRFSQIIDRTQVVDSVLHRSQIMRKKDLGHKMATAFMAEPTSTYNMLYRANLDAHRAGNKRTATKTLTRAAAAFVLSAATGAAAKSLITAIRDDDRKKDYSEKYEEAFIANMLDGVNPVALIPLGKDIVNVFQGYSPYRTDVQGFMEMKYAMDKVAKLWQGESEYTPAYVMLEAARSVSEFTGIPIDNLAREAESIANSVHQYLLPGESDDYQWSKFKYDIGSDDNLRRYAEMLLDAQENGDKQLEKTIMKELEAAGHDGEDVEKRIDSIALKRYKEDERVAEVARAKMNGDMEKYSKLYYKLVRDGYREKQLKSAIESINGKVTEKMENEKGGSKKEKENEKTEQEQAETAVSAYSSGDLIAAVRAFEPGKKESLRNFDVVVKDIYETKIKNGKTSKEALSSIKASITRVYKVEWIAAYNSGDRKRYEEIQNRLKQLRVDGKYLYTGSVWTDWKKAAKKEKE